MSDLHEDYFKDVKSPSFERQVHEAVREFLDLQLKSAPKEVTLRYVTYVFAQTLDQVADRILKRLN